MCVDMLRMVHGLKVVNQVYEIYMCDMQNDVTYKLRLVTIKSDCMCLH